MIKHQDVLELYDFKQSNLLKMVKRYQEIYDNCDDDRIIIDAYNSKIQKKDIDNIIKDEQYQFSNNLFTFFLNYILKYCNITNKLPPYFILLQTNEFNPQIDNIIIYNENEIQQEKLSKFKQNFKSLNSPIAILINTQNKWLMILLETQSWIIDFKCDQHTSFDLIQQFAQKFIMNTFGVQINHFDDFMIDYEQKGDVGDLILYTIYRFFIININLNEDPILTQDDITLARRRLIWLALSHMKDRKKEDDDFEFTRKVIEQQKKELLKKIQEDEEKKNQIKQQLQEKKLQTYHFINQEPPKIIVEEETLEQKLLKEKLAQFNVTRPRNIVEQYLTNLRAKQDYQFKYPDPPKSINIIKDPRAKVKNFVYQIQMPNVKPTIQQLITPASYCVSELFSDGNLKFQQPKLQQIYDYEILEKNKAEEQRFLQNLQNKNINTGFFGQIGSRLFDTTDYNTKKLIQNQQNEEQLIEKEDIKKIQRKKPLQTVDKINYSIKLLEDQLFNI